MSPSVSVSYRLLDTGWLASVKSEDGWQIIIWDDLLTYYASGLVKLRAGIGDDAGVFEGIPSVDVNNIYISSNNDRDDYTTPGLAPSVYSGLLRLLAQSLMGAQRTDDIHSLEDLCSEIATRLPVGLADYAYPDPKRTGCIRAPNGDYWLVFMKDQRGTTPTFTWEGKAFAVRLTPSADFNVLNQKIHSGEIPSTDAELADGFVLGYCELATVTDEFDNIVLDYVIFSDYEADGFNEETDAFATLFSKTDDLETFTPYETQASKDRYASIMNFMWGWTWKWQMRGKDDEKLPGGVVITGKEASTSETYRYHAGYVFHVAKISFEFDEFNRPSLTYDVGDWYHTMINTPANPAFYLDGTEEIGAANGLYATYPPRSMSPNIYSFSIPGQNLDVPNIIYAWFDQDGVFNSIRERRTYVTVSEVVTISYVTGITVCACTVWRIADSIRHMRLPGLFLYKGESSTTDIETVWTGKGYSDGYYLPGGEWNEYYGITWSENDNYQGARSVLYVHSNPGVFWLVQEKGPSSGWRTSIGGVDNESDPPVDASYGIWRWVYKEGYYNLHINDDLPCHVSNCFATTSDYEVEYTRLDIAKNTLSTGKELITVLDPSESELLSGLYDEIKALPPNTEDDIYTVPDFYLYSRPAFNISGYLYAEVPLDGLCTTCIETAPSVWIGAA